MLHIAVIADIKVTEYKIIALIILVKRVGDLQIVFICNIVITFQTSRKAAITLFLTFGRVALTEEISGTSGELQIINRGINKTFLNIESRVTIYHTIIAYFFIVCSLR